MADTSNEHAMAALRRVIFYLMENGVDNPVVILRKFEITDEESFILQSATDCGGLLIDGLGDGILLINNSELIINSEITNYEPRTTNNKTKLYNDTSFGILQAARTRMTKTEYISCPSCGRTLFDLQETTAMIRKRTDHLKGLKIGIMGCIVNGPGEMADADFGYVGGAPGKINLYVGRTAVEFNIPEGEAVNRLTDLIRSHGKWIDAPCEAAAI